MPKVRIEKTPIKVFHLGLFGFDHLLLTFQQLEAEDNGPQNTWYVMEGVRETGGSRPTLGVDGTSGSLTLAEAYAAYGDDLVAEIGTPQDRGSRVLLTGLEAYDSWQAMARRADGIEEQRLPYLGLGLLVAPTLNSSSVIATLLHSVGLDISGLLPEDLRISPGITTLIGTPDGDRMALSGNFNTLVGGMGRDILQGTHDLARIEKLYGGMEDDKIDWSKGFNIVHGGLSGEDFVTDGVDTMDYDGAGRVVIDQLISFDSHYIPRMIATRDSGMDWLFSIERFEWSPDSDTIVTVGNLRIVRDDILFDLRGEDDDGHGDEMSFDGQEDSLLINSSDSGLVFVQAEGSVNAETGLWIQSAEWLAGSALDDRIYTAEGVRGAEGGKGDDIVDGRLAAKFTPTSPLGYDIELYGGEGADTIVSSAGRSVAYGGAGADVFVLSSFSTADGVTEFVIADADASDRLTVPYDLLKVSRGDFDGSRLFPLLGAMGLPGQASFAELPVNLGLFSTSTESRSDFFQFEWRTQSQMWTGSDASQGVVEFTGMFLYNREGSDLIIHAFLGGTYPEENPWPHTETFAETNTETIIRIVDFQDGDLGIHFYDPGTPTDRDVSTPHGIVGVFDYPGWDSAVMAMTNGGALYDALDERPDTPAGPDLDGGSGARTMARVGRGTAGGDRITTGAEDDTLDGGAGADTLTGGGGNDVYVVDQSGDVIVEGARAGGDTVRSSVSFVLPVNVEHLELLGAAGNGTGNAGDNGLTGNANNNVLTGLGGDDVFFGLGGNDTLIGGAGDDLYYYQVGDGYDVIVDSGVGAGIDILFLGGITGADIGYLRPASDADDLVLVFETGGRILIEEFFASPSAGFERIMAGADTIERAVIEAVAGSLPLVTNEAPIALDDLGIGMRAGNVLIPLSVLLGNDSDFERDALSITAIVGAPAGVTIALESGGVRVMTALDYHGPADFTYTITDGHGGFDTAAVDLEVLANDAPTVAGSVADIRATGGERLSVRLPGGLFHDANGDRLGLTATLADGSPLPGWLTFDAASGTFQGLPPRSLSGRFDIVVTASDGAASAEAGLSLSVVRGRPVTTYNHIDGDVWANALVGTNGADRIDGKGGSDAMFGRGGDDVFVVAGKKAGFDVFVGGDGYDTVLGSSGNDTIRLARSAHNLDGIDAIKGGRGTDVVQGTMGNDRLDFSLIDVRGIERIELGSGNDRLVGSGGRDVIKGGAGADVFVFKLACGRDVILDFVTGHDSARHDRLDLSAFGFGSFADLMADADAVGHDTVLTLGPGASVRLVGVSLSEFSAGDVLL